MWCSARIPPYAPRKEKTDPHLVHLSASPRRHPYGSPEGRFAWDEASKVQHPSSDSAPSWPCSGSGTYLVIHKHAGAGHAPRPTPNGGFPPIKASDAFTFAAGRSSMQLGGRA